MREQKTRSDAGHSSLEPEDNFWSLSKYYKQKLGSSALGSVAGSREPAPRLPLVASSGCLDRA